MAKIRKAVFRSGIVMLSLLAAVVLSGSVAQAQECFAFQSSPETARAEGMTEAMGGIQLQCRAQETFGAPPIADEVEISIKLNTQITNETNDAGDMVMGLSYSGSLGTPSTDYTGDDKEVLSDGDTTITWTIPTDSSEDGGIDFPNTVGGSTVTISGIMANASGVGAGNDVTAEVRVNGVVIEHSPIKLADVMTGLMVTVTSADGLQCLVPTHGTGGSMDGVVATIKVVEGFDEAFATDDASLGTSVVVLNFSNIPEGVTVTPSMTGLDAVSDGIAEDPVDGRDLAAFTRQDTGVDEDGNVELEDGKGSVRYAVGATDANDTGDVVIATSDGEMEWNQVTVTFEWEIGVPLGTGMVTTSYHPSSGDDAIYVPGAAMDVLEIEECVTSLVFPFVTNAYGYETGIAITNVSSETGSCMLTFEDGSETSVEHKTEDIMGNSVMTFGVNMIAPGFQGYMEATCEFRNGKGFAFISNGFQQMGGPTAAQGYLVSDELQKSD